jgi:hypothetical protein
MKDIQVIGEKRVDRRGSGGRQALRSDRKIR